MRAESRPGGWCSRAPSSLCRAGRLGIDWNAAIPAEVDSLLDAQDLQQSQPDRGEYLQAIGQPDSIADARQFQGRARSLRDSDQE